MSLDNLLTELKVKHEEASNAANEMIVVLLNVEGKDASKITLDRQVSNTVGTLGDVQIRLDGYLSLVKTITESKRDDLLLVPRRNISTVYDRLDKISQECRTVLDLLRQVRDDGGYGSVEQTDFTIKSVNNGQAPNLTANIHNIDGQVEEGLEAVYLVTSIIKSGDYDAFRGAVGRIGKITSEVVDAKKQVDELKQSVAEAESGIKTKHNTVNSAAEEVGNIKDQVASDGEFSSKNRAQIESDAQEVSNVLARAEALQQTVDQYQEKFTAFDTQLSQRNETFAVGTNEFKDLRSRMSIAEQEQQKILTEAKEALGWASASGLAKSFQESSSELDNPIWWARLSFYVSIVLLFVSVAFAFNQLPLANRIFQFPPLRPPEGTDVFSAAIFALGSLSVKAAALLPALLLVGFTSRRHRALFQAKERYRFKKTVASAIPGFKEQAPSHQEHMAAAAFERLLFNPEEEATRDLEGKPRGGRLSRWLVELIKQALSEVKK